MKVVVIGVGQVGSSVAHALAGEHEVIAVDKNADRLEKIRSETDVLTYEGNGARVDVLESAEVQDADLVIGSTSDDRSNILICSTARAMNRGAFTIARVAETEYLATWSQLREAFNVDFMVGADHLTARNIVEVVGLPTARNVEHFGQGRVVMAEFTVPEASPIAGKTVEDLRLTDGVNFVAVFDDEHMEIVRGTTCLRPGIRLLVIGRPRQVEEFAGTLTPKTSVQSARRIMILGGGEIGYQTARMLEQRGLQPRLVEKDPDRAHALAQELPDTLVLQDDATDPKFLRRQGVADTDLVVSALTPDERNLLTSTLSRDLGAGRVLSVVHRDVYESVFTSSGIDTTVNPRREVIEEILRHTRVRGIEKITFVERDRGEVVEVELTAESPLVGHPIEEAVETVPHNFVLGAVIRDGEVLIPRGQTVLKSRDHLVMFVETDVSAEVLEAL
ncbi:Trk system potassium transporter TrkA [Salinibacter grassmerensis]|uniref:Trk system potassium transporter TrkA n=1 Tax=Salinibacter grassmerensis TaxID=3040353 RepID=UPI0021E8A8B5|nr:Trk system potassium transporter TrkA [Salinibacter grassmerensis]